MKNHKSRPNGSAPFLEMNTHLLEDNTTYHVVVTTDEDVDIGKADRMARVKVNIFIVTTKFQGIIWPQAL